ncbi:unnamed protein product [Parnassius apollo]|uniref:(apollo) hypothetical protein n=1 Tax=Parnassius apollo TaxID=110799 RepID=A0A8S3XH69_PARAO|nr:unnamed protein product [Parnassius apollo]
MASVDRGQIATVNMCLSPNSNLVQRTIDLNYAKQKRTTSIKWFFVNVFFFLLFTYDLTCTGPCPASLARYTELALAGIACASAFRHAICLLPRKTPPPAQVSRQQLRLLGLNETDLDSSLVLSEASSCSAAGAAAASDAELSLSLSPRRWCEPPAPLAPALPALLPALAILPALPSVTAFRATPRRTTRRGRARRRARGAGGEPRPPAAPHAPHAPAYQLAPLDSETGKLEEGSPEGSPQIYWQLDIDPQKLTQWNLNLRLWIHITILERLVRALDEVDAELMRLGLGEARPGLASAERLRQLAAALPLGSLAALLPYLEPFPDQRYVVRRIRDLARAPCLSNYRWDAGASDWDPTQPTDADIILHLFATYLDGQMVQSGNPRPFSSQYLSVGGAGAGVGSLALHRVSSRPPQFALALGGELVGVPRGRANLLHALLLLLAAAARRRPPALARTHLGPAGLNMLWIIGR